jgi:hypothetical protein
MSLPSANDPFIESIAERVRGVVARQPRYTCAVLSGILDIPQETLRCIQDTELLIDPIALIDVVAALVREFAVDPQWLLTGEYDGATHRQALILGEDRTPSGARAVHRFVHDQYRRLREAGAYLSMPSPHGAAQ